MWKYLYQLASPKIFYNFSGIAIRWLLLLACIFLISGVTWGLFFAPADYQQGDAFRIIYIHVPAAFLSVSLYAFMGFLSVLLLVWRIKIAGIMLTKVAQVGTYMTLLALVTGSIWGKPMWGAWWVWDARLTSELILFFLYLSILATSQSFQSKDKSDKVVAVLCIVGIVDLPIIHYSVYWWNTLHQGETITVFAKPKIASQMLYPLLLTITGFILYCVVLILSKTRSELLWRERQQKWVQYIVMGVK